jgi:hypothetical protein
MMAALALASMAMVGCAKVPQAAIDQARQAMAAAEEVESASYAPEAYQTARQAMSAASAELEVQQEKFALLRSYERANELLATAQQDAVTAEQTAVAARQQAKADAEQAIVAIDAGLAKADALLGDLASCRRRPKGFAGDLELLRGTVDGLRSQVSDVESTLADEDYLEAKTLAQELNTQVETVVADLEQAKSKIGC